MGLPSLQHDLTYYDFLPYIHFHKCVLMLMSSERAKSEERL